MPVTAASVQAVLNSQEELPPLSIAQAELVAALMGPVDDAEH